MFRGLITVSLACGAGPAHSQIRDAGMVLAAARTALGGDAALAAVKTIVASGRTRQIRGNNTVPIEFEIVCQLPDACVRREEYPAQNTDPSTMGFHGDTLILSAGTQPPPGALPAPARLAPVQIVKQEFVRLLVGVFAGSVTTYPLTFSYAAEADAPEGKADVINVVGPSGFAPRLVIQRDTQLPVMLMWQAAGAPGPIGPAGPPRPAVPPAPPSQASAPGAGGGAPAVEHRLYYADYRTVSGIKWPFRLRRAIAGSTTEETTFDRVRLNVKIDPRTFEVPK